MHDRLPLDPATRADHPAQDAARDDGTHEVLPDVAYKRLAIVNVAYIGLPHTDAPWVLVDTGVPMCAGAITRAAHERFGKNSMPAAIVMTHGHFDHVGSLRTLAEQWDVPIYAHELELPYLNGVASYPPPDPSVGGGVMSLLSPLFPRGPIDVSRWLKKLPDDGSVPALPGWKWLPTPGHSVGHVSLWRESDRTLVVGDAFVTTKQESIYNAALQTQELHGPPMYFTQNWDQARASVELLASLEPSVAVTGHGRAMQGPKLRRTLHALARNFEQFALPEKGKYVAHPIHAEDASAYAAP